MRFGNSAAALAESRGGLAMALQAKSADVGQIAFASALHNRDDVIGVPQAFPSPWAQTPCEQRLELRRSAQPLQLPFGTEAIDTADGADAAVALQHFFAEIAGVGAQAPFFHALGGAKGRAAFGHLKIAPAA